MTDIVKRLCKLTDQAGITHRELAKRMGVQEASICRYFKGAYEPGVFVLSRWAEALGLHIDAVQNLDDSRRPVRILQERNRNLMIENAKLEQLLKRIRFEIEQEADYNNAVVNADVARGMYHAAEIIDKFMKERNGK